MNYKKVGREKYDFSFCPIIKDKPKLNKSVLVFYHYLGKNLILFPVLKNPCQMITK